MTGVGTDLARAAAAVREAEANLVHARIVRDALIVKAIEDGDTVYGVAKQAGIQRNAVYHIIDRNAAEKSQS